MAMSTLEEPDFKTQQVSKTKAKSNSKDVEKFIKQNLPTIDRPIIKTTMANVAPSYWRVNVWGRKLNSECAFGDNEIIMSKFIRIDVDEDGNLVYNDMTEGKEL